MTTVPQLIHFDPLIDSLRGQTFTLDTNNLFSFAFLVTAGPPGGPTQRYLLSVTALDTRQETLESIRTFLRADKALSPESADAITSVLRAAYDQLAQRNGVDERAGDEAEAMEPQAAGAA